MIGNKYRLFGTATIFEIVGEDNGYWILKVYEEGNEDAAAVDVLMTKQSLQDSISQGKIELLS